MRIQESLATVSRTAESSSASRLWRVSGKISRSPRAASHDRSAAESRTRPCKINPVASPGLSCSAEARTSDHADHGLAEHFLVTAEDGIRGVSTSGGGSQLHLLARESLEGDLLHGNSLSS